MTISLFDLALFVYARIHPCSDPARANTSALQDLFIAIDHAPDGWSKGFVAVCRATVPSVQTL